MTDVELQGEDGYTSGWAGIGADSGGSHGAGQGSDEWSLNSKDLWKF